MSRCGYFDRIHIASWVKMLIICVKLNYRNPSLNEMSRPKRVLYCVKDSGNDISHCGLFKRSTKRFGLFLNKQNIKYMSWLLINHSQHVLAVLLFAETRCELTLSPIRGTSVQTGTINLVVCYILTPDKGIRFQYHQNL